MIYRPADRSGNPLRGYNLTDFADDPIEVLGAAGKIGVYYMGQKLLQAIPDPAEKGLISGSLHQFKDALATVCYSNRFTKAGKDFPFIARRDAFRRGSTDIDSSYTVTYKFLDYKGKKLEMPLHVSWKSDMGIDDLEDKKRQIKEICRSGRDQEKILDFHRRLNGPTTEELKKHYTRIWSFTDADNEYIHGDLKGREQLDRFFKEFARLDIIATQKFGEGKKVYEDGEIVITRYARPNDLTTWAFHEGGSRWYDVKDAALYNLARGLGIPGAQLFVEDEVHEHVDGMKKIPFGREPLMHST
jgi:hypothetical protein